MKLNLFPPSKTPTQVIDAMTNFLQATMSANTGDVHEATINFVNAFMNADNNTTAAMNFLSAIAVIWRICTASIMIFQISNEVKKYQRGKERSQSKNQKQFSRSVEKLQHRSMQNRKFSISSK